jgi:hypothetical protein
MTSPIEIRGGRGQSAVAKQLQKLPCLHRYHAGYWYAVGQFQKNKEGSIP